MRVVGGPFRQGVVEHAVPGDAVRERQAVAENVRPGADDLVVDFLIVHPFVPLRRRLDEARKERPHLKAIVERKRFLAASAGARRTPMPPPLLLIAAMSCGGT